MKIKNWHLLVLASLFIALFCWLGNWQLRRAHEKETLLQSFLQRTQQAPLKAQQLKSDKDLRFYKIALQGHYDNKHNLLLDNKIFHGKVGYELYTPFFVDGFKTPLLIDRGFIAQGPSRQLLPSIKSIFGSQSITGLLNLPPHYVALGNMNEYQLTWPLRIQYFDNTALQKILGFTLFPYIITLEQNNPAAYEIDWHIVTMSPERHRGYAVQWFALALTLLILSVALLGKKISSNNKNGRNV